MRWVGVAVAAVLVAGCAAKKDAERAQAPAARPSVGIIEVPVGQAVTLTGADDSGGADRLKLSVKAEKVVQRAKGRGAYAKPRKGERFLAVRFRLTNTGDATYDDSPTYGAKALDRDGHGYDPTVTTVSAGPGFARSVKLQHGQSRSGYVVFAVPVKARIDSVEYSLNAGYGAHAGQWRLS